MISTALFLIFWFSTFCMVKNNPVKMKVSIMLSSLLILLVLKIISSNSWIPFIFCLLYMGGILMMFMVLSSFLPNKKMYKNSDKFYLGWVPVSMAFPISATHFVDVSVLKTFVEIKLNFFFMTMWILSFFFGFILIISESNTSMRSSAL